jgi:hypothetical protein
VIELSRIHAALQTEAWHFTPCPDLEVKVLVGRVHAAGVAGSTRTAKHLALADGLRPLNICMTQMRVDGIQRLAIRLKLQNHCQAELSEILHKVDLSISDGKDRRAADGKEIPTLVRSRSAVSNVSERVVFDVLPDLVPDQRVGKVCHFSLPQKMTRYYPRGDIEAAISPISRLLGSAKRDASVESLSDLERMPR